MLRFNFKQIRVNISNRSVFALSRLKQGFDSPRERHGLQDAVARVLKSPRAKLVFLKKSLGERLICEGAGP